MKLWHGDRMEHLDAAHLAKFLGMAIDDEVYAALEKAGFGEVREAHGFVVQRLLTGPQSASALAADLDVSQQLASRWVGELKTLGLVTAAKGDDGREKRVALSAKGERVVKVTREARLKALQALEKKVGTTALARLKKDLLGALTALGWDDAIARRKVRPGRGR